MSRLSRAALASLFSVAPVSAQAFDLVVDGGSMPGQIQWQLGPGQPFLQFGLILISVTPGPTPLAILNPLDPRVLSVGLELIDVAQAGVFQPDGRFTPPPLPVPNMPSIVDAPLFLQGLSLPGSQFLVDKMSEPRVVRFAPTGQWRDRFVALATPRAFCPVAERPDGEWIALGGGSGALFAQIAQKSTEIYDPLRDQFRQGPDMNSERSLHTATRLLDGRYLIVGGVDFQNDPSTSAEIYDPVAHTFTPTGAMRDPRMGHAAALLPDGRVLVSGGIRDLNQPNTPIDPIFSTTDRTEIWNPATGTWTPGPNLSRPRAGHSAITLPNGKILHAGGIGFRTIIVNLPVVESTTDLFDTGTGTFSTGPSMNQARGVFATVEIAPGRFLVSGGVGTITLTQWGTMTPNAEIYDTASNRWTSTGAMQQRRALHAVFPLGGGRFLHVGGADGALFALNPLATTEVYDAGTGQWSSGPSMSRSRAAFASYVNDTGQFHVISGQVATSGVDNSSEWFYR